MDAEAPGEESRMPEGKKLVPVDGASAEGQGTPLELIVASEFGADLPVTTWAQEAHRSGWVERYAAGAAVGLLATLLKNWVAPFAPGTTFLLIAGLCFWAGFTTGAHLVADKFQGGIARNLSGRLASLARAFKRTTPVTVVVGLITAALLTAASGPSSGPDWISLLTFVALVPGLPLAYCFGINEALFDGSYVGTTIVAGAGRMVARTAGPRSSLTVKSPWHFLSSSIAVTFGTAALVFLWSVFCFSFSLSGFDDNRFLATAAMLTREAGLTFLTFGAVQLLARGGSQIAADQALQIGAEGRLALADRSPKPAELPEASGPPE